MIRFKISQNVLFETSIFISKLCFKIDHLKNILICTKFSRTLTKTIYISVIFSTLNSILSVANLSRLECAKTQFTRKSHAYEYFLALFVMLSEMIYSMNSHLNTSDIQSHLQAWLEMSIFALFDFHKISYITTKLAVESWNAKRNIKEIDQSRLSILFIFLLRLFLKILTNVDASARYHSYLNEIVKMSRWSIRHLKIAWNDLRLILRNSLMYMSYSSCLQLVS